MAQQTGTRQALQVESSSVGRPRTKQLKPGEIVHLSFNIESDIVIAIDKEAERIEAERPGIKVDRTSAIRVLLREALTVRTKHRK
jgi:hypothetical protein